MIIVESLHNQKKAHPSSDPKQEHWKRGSRGRGPTDQRVQDCRKLEQSKEKAGVQSLVNLKKMQSW